MKKIDKNNSPEADSHCFACSKNNPRGLKMEFYEDADEIVSIWHPSWYYDGWSGIMHGGIIATLLDETGEWFLFAKMNLVGLTSDLNIKYKKPLKTTEGEIEIRAKLNKKIRNIVIVSVHILDNKKHICAEAEIRYFTYPKELAHDKINFRK